MITTPFPAYYTGFADEAGVDLDTQIRVTKELGWNAIKMRNVWVSGHEAGNLHHIPDAAWSRASARRACG